MTNKNYIRKTSSHIRQVQENIQRIKESLEKRSINHDKSKLSGIEKLLYLRNSPAARKLHYRKNRHHPEHFEHGFSDMNIVDLAEIICDWAAEQESLAEKREKYNIDKQLYQIIENSINLLRRE